VLAGGRILQTGTPQAVYERPASAAVARLVGLPRINLIDATAVERWWTAGGVRIAPHASVDPAGRAILGVRPEDLLLHGGDGAGEVQLVEHLGAVLLVTLAWAGTRVQALVGKDQAPRRGDTVRPRVDPQHVHRWPIPAQ
jgi:multiple sugar transport system ATP-binding protein